MFAQLTHWYQALTPLKQLIISFLLTWIFWLAAWLIGERVFFDESMSWAYHFFHATWMAFFTIVPFNWKRIKAGLKENMKPPGSRSAQTPGGLPRP